MAFLQKRFCHPTGFQAGSLSFVLLKAGLLKSRLFKSSSFKAPVLKSGLLRPASLKAGLLKNESGFLIVGLLSFLSLMFVTLIGFSLLSIGIKNITQAQSSCLTELSQTQKELGQKLQQLLKLNDKARLLDKTRKGIDASIAAALASVVLIPKIPALEKSKDLVQLAQKTLIGAQKGILIQSQMIKVRRVQKLKTQLKTLNAKRVWESSFYKKALAVEKEKIGEKAYIYKPAQEFKAKQRIKVSWSLSAFYPIEKDLSWIFKPFSLGHSKLNSSLKRGKPTGSLLELGGSGAFSIEQSCALTLEQRGEEWISRLTH